MVTVSVHCWPETVELSPKVMLNVFPRFLDVELEAGMYFLWPAQLESQAAPGTKRSDEPVSKSTGESMSWFTKISQWEIIYD